LCDVGIVENFDDLILHEQQEDHHQQPPPLLHSMLAQIEGKMRFIWPHITMVPRVKYILDGRSNVLNAANQNEKNSLDLGLSVPVLKALAYGLACGRLAIR
jgi:hypothetical protein